MEGRLAKHHAAGQLSLGMELEVGVQSRVSGVARTSLCSLGVEPGAGKPPTLCPWPAPGVGSGPPSG